MPLRPVDPEVSFAELEMRILEHWDRSRAFERSSAERDEEDADTYTFFDGPPFATGRPHYGHLVGSILKDVVPRYWAMHGKRVVRRWGWDCHGLPVENEVQKELGLEDTRAVEAFGIEAFNDACRGLVGRYADEWQTTIRRLGRWVDFENGYSTMDASYMESVWWVFDQLMQKGLIYEGYKVQPLSPVLGTPLSNFEVALGPQERDPKTGKDGHKRVQDPSVTVRFRLEDEEASLWAWTTTPWTLPSNLALAVNPALEYVKVRVLESGEVVYLEPGRLAHYQERGQVGETEELERLSGAQLVGRPYAPLLPYFEHEREDEQGKRVAFMVVGADYVGTDAGTGIVHQAPAFGEDDFRVGQREGMPLVCPVDRSGRFDSSVPDFEGLFVKDADKPIIARLKADGNLVVQDTIVHAYPHCYRSGAPLIYMALSTWFMRVEGMVDELLASNDQVHWVPESVGSGRFGNWLAGARDWNLARNRFWGTPLPLWRCDLDSEEIVSIGSVAELERRAGLEPGSITDLHRDHVDDITFPSEKTPGGVMRRVSEVFDCWFESGSMPYAQNHYPFENEELVQSGLPADFIAEGLDQTRGWFYTLTVLSTALFGRPAFKNVIVNGIVLAQDGAKMSKSKQNFPDPNRVLEKYGADALRIYLMNSPVMNAKDLRFEEAGVAEHIRSVMLPLWNAYSFLTRYADIHGWEPDGVDPDPGVNELDGWVLSRLQTLIASTEEHMAAYELHRVVPSLLGFIEELTNWYIRRSRRRFWNEDGASIQSVDGLNAYRTLHHVELTLTRVLAPFLPFVTEEIYSNLSGEAGLDSVHLERYPVVRADWVDSDLERRMDLARRTVGLARGLRVRENVRTRQPLPELTVALSSEEDRRDLEACVGIIAEELNVKSVCVSSDEASLVTYGARPNLKVLGPRFGKRLGDIRSEVAGLTSETLAEILAGAEVPSAGVQGLVYDLETLLVDRTAREGTVTVTSDGLTVALDLTITSELRAEGLAREVINRIQNQRKAANLALDDRIEVCLQTSDELLRGAIETHWALIAGQTLSLGEGPNWDAAAEGGSEHDLDGSPLWVSLGRVPVADA
jgi:isoleucyl-tRNA synthetase